MDKRRIFKGLTAAALAAALAFGSPALPETITGLSGLVFDAEAASSDFTIEKDGTIKKYTGKGGKVTIPSKINGITVKKIGGWTFWKTGVTEVILPDTVTELDEFAFTCAYSLKNITLSKRLKKVGRSAFDRCDNLTELNIPASVTDFAEYSSTEYGEGIDINRLNSLKSITVDKNNKYYKSENGILYSKDGKRLLMIPAMIEMTEFTVPSSVELIGRYAYYYDIDHGASPRGNIKKLTIPGTVKTISYLAFNGANIETLSIGEGVTKIDEDAFRGCEHLKKVNIPESVKGTLDGTFNGCNDLESITIPKGITKIGGNFANGTKISSITIPKGVTEIGTFAFKGCNKLKSVKIPGGVTIIGLESFENCTSLKNVTLPSSLKTICGRAFKNCTSLKNITIPDSVEKVGYDAFEGCTNIKIKYKGKTYTAESFSKYCKNKGWVIITF